MNFASIPQVLLGLSSVLLSSFLFGGNAAWADVSISPMVFETEAKRGQTQGTVTIYNADPKAFRARVYTAPFTYERELGFQALSSSQNDLAPYLQFSPRELQVNGSGKRNIRFIVRFPPSLPDGEYRTMVFTENLQTATVTQNDTKNNVVFNTTIVPRIGVAVYVRKGNVSPSLSAVSARLSPKAKKIQLLVSNKGKASAIVAGNWTLKKAGQVIQKGTTSDTTIIAEGDRYISVNSTTPNQPALKPGDYELSGDFGWGENKKNRFPFKVTLTVPK